MLVSMRHHVDRQVLAEQPGQFAGGDRLAGVKGDEFRVTRARGCDHDDVGNGGMLADGGFDLAEFHPVATDLYLVVHSSQMDHSVFSKEELAAIVPLSTRRTTTVDPPSTRR